MSGKRTEPTTKPPQCTECADTQRFAVLQLNWAELESLLQMLGDNQVGRAQALIARKMDVFVCARCVGDAALGAVADALATADRAREAAG